MFKWFKRKRKSREEKMEALNPLIELLTSKKTSEDEAVFRLKTYEKDGVTFKLGDKVMVRSNECGPLLVGNIVEFWDNNGKWSECIPQIVDSNDNVWGVMGIMKHYSDELHNDIKDLRPLEQWNYFLPGDSPFTYTEEGMTKKEDAYKKREKVLGG